MVCKSRSRSWRTIERILEESGSDLSAEDYKELNDAAEGLWEATVKLGC